MSEERKEETPASLTITDLSNLLAIVDFAAQQGAFKGWDVVNRVLAVRNKLANFLEANAPKQEEKEEAQVKEEVKEVAAEKKAKRAKK